MYTNELSEIIELRKKVYAIDMPIFTALLLGIVSSFILPILAPVFGIMVFYFFYKKLMNFLHAPCPRCSEPFGTTSRWALGADVIQCQNCKLDLYENGKL